MHLKALSTLHTCTLFQAKMVMVVMLKKMTIVAGKKWEMEVIVDITL